MAEPRIFIFLLLVTCIVACYSRITCEEDKCSLCRDTDCVVTCSGYDCEDCPRGNCCNGNNCNVCIDSQCCETYQCNACVRRCSRRCPINRLNEKPVCRDRCSKQCLNGGYTNETTTQIKQEYKNEVPNHYNVTTVIKLYNLLNNTNVIDTPVNINVTNLNNITVNSDDLAEDFVGPDGVNPGESSSKCCHIIHPEECPEEQICFRRKHVECSYLCISEFIIIRQDEDANNTCIPILTYPDNYCGKYVVEDCSSCFNCNDNNCENNQNCSPSCRAGIVPEKFYNVPYKRA